MVTGAVGFVGRHVVYGALAAGHRVTAVVRPGKDVSMLGKNKNLSIGHWDVGAGPPSANLFDEVTAVCHAAAFIPPDKTASAYAEQCVRVNAIGTLSLLEAISNRTIHLVQISAGQLYEREGRLAKEGDPVWPASRAAYYLSSKLLAELYIDHFARQGRVSATLLRVGSVYGPAMSAGAVRRFLSNAKKGVPIEIPADSTYTVDLVYVNDVAQAVLTSVRQRCAGTFNIGSGAAVSLETLARTALAVCGAQDSLLHRVPDDATKDHGFDGLDISRAVHTLGFAPTPLTEGLRATAQAMFRDS